MWSFAIVGGSNRWSSPCWMCILGNDLKVFDGLVSSGQCSISCWTRCNGYCWWLHKESLATGRVGKLVKQLPMAGGSLNFDNLPQLVGTILLVLWRSSSFGEQASWLKDSWRPVCWASYCGEISYFQPKLLMFSHADAYKLSVNIPMNHSSSYTFLRQELFQCTPKCSRALIFCGCLK